MSNNLNYFVVVLFISMGFCASDFIQLCLVIQRYFQIRDLQRTPGLGIRLSNISYSRKNCIIYMCSSIVLVVSFYFAYKYYHDMISRTDKMVYIAIFTLASRSFLFFTAMSIMRVLISVMAVLFGEYAFLTPDGVVTIESSYPKGKCRYVMDYEQTGKDHYQKFISVYKKRLKAPQRYLVIEKEEQVIQWVNKL